MEELKTSEPNAPSKKPDLPAPNEIQPSLGLVPMAMALPNHVTENVRVEAFLQDPPTRLGIRNLNDRPLSLSTDANAPHVAASVDHQLQAFGKLLESPELNVKMVRIDVPNVEPPAYAQPSPSLNLVANQSRPFGNLVTATADPDQFSPADPIQVPSEGPGPIKDKSISPTLRFPTHEPHPLEAPVAACDVAATVDAARLSRPELSVNATTPMAKASLPKQDVPPNFPDEPASAEKLEEPDSQTRFAPSHESDGSPKLGLEGGSRYVETDATSRQDPRHRGETSVAPTKIVPVSTEPSSPRPPERLAGKPEEGEGAMAGLAEEEPAQKDAAVLNDQNASMANAEAEESLDEPTKGELDTPQIEPSHPQPESVTGRHANEANDHPEPPKPVGGLRSISRAQLAHADRIEAFAATRPRGTITIDMDPLDLGKIQLVVKQSDGAIEAHVVAQDERVRQALQASQAHLAQSFESRGARLDQFHVSAPTSSTTSEFGRDHRQPPHPSPAMHQSGRLNHQASPRPVLIASTRGGVDLTI